jgi:RNA polymerase sigma factor (sigma-70 family)
MANPLTEPAAPEPAAPDPSDEALVARALKGDRDALDLLLRRHQRFLYNLALRMLQRPEDAEDAVQESLLKIVTRLSTFRGESAFRTWAYRIALRHVLDFRRSRPERAVAGFDCYAGYLARAPDEDLADADALPADTRLVVEEARLACTLGMLLCLDRDHRLAFVLGELFEVTDALGAEVLDIGRDAFRQRLSRARRQLREFVTGRCGLVDPVNPCRCARKTRAFIRDGIVDPARLVFARPHLARMTATSAGAAVALESARTAPALWGDQPDLEPPDLVARLRSLLGGDALRAALNLA